MSLTADQIEAADDLPREIVPIKRWGGDVWIRALNGEGGEQLFPKGDGAEADGETDGEQEESPERDKLFAHRLIALTLCDEKGVPLFEDVDHGIAVLRRKYPKTIPVLFKVACRLNGVELEEGEAGKDLGATPEDDSGSS